jgi:SNF2 family DNA or RNA helicase
MVHNLIKLYNKGLISNLEHYREAFQYTSKLDSVIDCIVSNRDNNKGKIVFCTYREEIDTICKRLQQKGMDSIAIYDGRTTNSQRLQILNNKNNVLILQIQTGCEGINLQENYSEIYFVSPNWNPAIEDQAIARCHRIGQLNEVNVHRFKMTDFVDSEEENVGMSMDNYITCKQDFKRQIASDILDN